MTKSPRGRCREEKPGGTEYIHGSLPKLILQVFKVAVWESADWHAFTLDTLLVYTIRMRIHLIIMLCSIITHYQMRKYCIYVKMYSVISKNY